jgi:hypothetical protein
MFFIDIDMHVLMRTISFEISGQGMTAKDLRSFY